MVVLILLIISGCSKGISKQDAEEIAFSYDKCTTERQLKAMSEANLSYIGNIIADYIGTYLHYYKPFINNSYKRDNGDWHVFISYKDIKTGDVEENSSELIVHQNKLVEYSDKSEDNSESDCRASAETLKDWWEIKEEQKEEAYNSCKKIKNLFLKERELFYADVNEKGSLDNIYAITLKEKKILSNDITDKDIFPKTLAGYPMMSISKDPEIHQAQYGNFEYGDGGYKSLNEGDIFIILTYEKYGCKSKDLIYIGNEKYYYKSQPLDYEYIIWHNGVWKFTLLHYNGKDDSILLKSFKELKY